MYTELGSDVKIMQNEYGVFLYLRKRYRSKRRYSGSCKPAWNLVKRFDTLNECFAAARAEIAMARSIGY